MPGEGSLCDCVRVDLIGSPGLSLTCSNAPDCRLSYRGKPDEAVEHPGARAGCRTAGWAVSSPTSFGASICLLAAGASVSSYALKTFRPHHTSAWLGAGPFSCRGPA